MKRIQILLILLVTFASLQGCCYLGDCNDDDIGDPLFIETEYTPVVMNRTEFEESVALLPARPIVNTGKIYAFGTLLFVNEKHEGFHVILNSDPSNPIPLNFIKSPGATDISVRDGVYYINQAVDLIAISYDNESSGFTVSKRIRNVFPTLRSPDGFYHFTNEEEIVVHWILTPQP
ncbi:hypothetical protein [Ulvibacter litoralis]|uniref:LVIVD repeat-containing protein n=1 Tax=Ulvibacter litoralis TaxID=227084 RepID=A0A1G7F0U9_9FLAO|nr:hypothetical protein [Ulvibacter litoralis]GHC53166.1 hypothetical protein GCM10008083_16420 [Ulvibacter litoralis]SDE69487.1 hypothetical protein SAMN05421855_102257 [Ulvibacter litoralis]